MAVGTPVLVTKGGSSTGATSYATPSISVTSGEFYLISFSTRTGITANPNVPTASGAGLTITQAPTNGSVVYDDTSSSRKRVTLFYALCSSTTSGAITFDEGGQTQTNAEWVIEKITSGLTTTGTNGVDAIVQCVNAKDGTATVSTLTATLAAFGSVNNATYGTIANGTTTTMIAGTGFSIIDQDNASGTMALAAEFRVDNSTSVGFSNSGVNDELGVIAIELKAIAVVATNLTTGADTDGNSTATTASKTITANNLVILSVVSRTGITANPNQPTATGLSATWVVDTNASVVYDATSSSRRRLTVFRTMVGSNQTGTIAIDFGGQNQTDVTWSLDQFSGTDTTGTNGSGAIVQVTNNIELSTATCTVTLAAFSSVNNATLGVFGNAADNTITPTAGTGFTLLGNGADTANGARTTTEFRSDNSTSVAMTWTSSSEEGGVAIEIKLATTTTTATARLRSLLGVGL